MKHRKYLLAGAAVIGMLPLTAFAQSTAEVGSSASDDIIVTGVARASDRISTSISVSTVSAEQIQNSAPSNLSEVFKALPGIRSEASSGGGNSNMGVRGLPVSTGGAKFLQMQEDGLPIMLFGDFDFAPADGFYKADGNLLSVESVRGGSASTLTTNGPGGIINLISNNGEKQGGSISVETGLSYDNYRVDGNYGGRLSDNTYYFVGGHYQVGGDNRGAGFNTIEGGQLRASITREFENGFLRVYGKVVNKTDGISMPQPMALSADGLTVKGDLPGLRANDQTLLSPYTRYYRIVKGDNTVADEDAADGFKTNLKSIGAELSFDVGNGFQLDNKARYQSISGNFAAPFAHAISNADTLLATSYGGAAATFANGPNKGRPVTSATLTALNGNPLITEVSQFSTELQDLSNFANDLRLSRSFDFDGAKLDVTAGYFFMNQKFKEDWHWQRFLVDTSNNAAMIDIAGFTDGGILGYNQGFGWDGNNRNYDLDFEMRAPFVAATLDVQNFTFDASVRKETMSENGFVSNAAGGPLDVDGDGVIDPPEADVSLNQGPATAQRLNFKVDHTSYSVGVNYKITPNLAVFARQSEGAAFNGERQAFSAAVNGNSGAVLLRDQFVDVVKQFEAGVKWRTEALGGNARVNLTYFDADTEESNSNTTSGGPPTSLDIAYSSKGVEGELVYNRGPFSFGGSATYTDAEVTENRAIPTDVGHKPRRQADWIWSAYTSYSIGPAEFGATLQGTSDSYSGFNNRTIMPGYQTLGAFVNWSLSDRMVLSLNGTNLTDEVGITEAQDDPQDAVRKFDTNGDGVPDVISARSIPGRTISARLRYTF